MNSTELNGNIDEQTEAAIAEAIKGKSSSCSNALQSPSSSCPIKKEKHKVMTVTPRNDIGRNRMCPCGSKIKYKKCCLPKRTYTPGE